MRFDTGQQMRMDQRMKLDPRMIQSMEILQMPTPALEERIEQELASNPTLEIAQAGADADTLQAEREQAHRDDYEGERELVVDDGAANHAEAADDFERLSNLSEQYGESWESNTFESGGSDFARRQVSSSAGDRDGKLDAMANTAARGASLYDQLIDQWHLAEIPVDLAPLGDFLIGFIDADGYLRSPVEELLPDAPNGTTAELISATTGLLQQTLDPPGLAARDFRECLLLQIDAKLDEDPDLDLDLPRQLVDHHLKDIEANRYPKIAKATDRSIEELQQAVLKLRQFHPHPGRLLASDEVRTITPDATIDYDDENDAYTATLTHGRLPALTISRDYQDLAKDKDADKKTRDFVSKNLSSARWLIDAINQRNNTLLRVIGVVVQAQRDFFDQGPQALKPLPMTTVADQLGIHVATVSRAVSEKYLQTPRGILPLRMFFSGGTESSDGESMAWGAVQHKLKEVIEAEDKKSPMTDDELVAAMKDQGIDIARRTIAKYRKLMNIASARQRREY
ncbi:MAG: RNA polymerase factor sigma-54 [Planctomycetota bacterium]